MPPPAGPRSWTRIVPGASGVADRRERRAALAHDPRDGGQRLDVVDDRRPAEQAVLGGVGRLLLGLAALPLERLQQDRLLAQHVRALDGPDRHVDPVAAVEHVLAEEAGLLGRQRRALEPGDQRRVVGPDGEDRLGRAGGEGRDREALEDQPRIGAQQRGVGLDARVGAVAVGDDVALPRRPGGRGAPLLAGWEAGPAPAAEPGGGDGRDRPGGAEVAHGDPQALERAGACRRSRSSGSRLEGRDPAGEDRRPVARRRQERVIGSPAAP